MVPRAAAKIVLGAALAAGSALALSWLEGGPASRRPTERRAAAAALVPAPASTPSPVSPPTPAKVLEGRAAIGHTLFFDATLSDPPGTSCASCHDPAHGYAGDHGSPIGVPRGSRPGHFARRSTPSVLYLRFFPRFHFEWPEEALHPEPYGGFFWDGRSSSVAELVRQPLLNPDEMGNRDVGRIAKAVRASAYAGDLQSEFDHVFDSPEETMDAVGACLEAFLTAPAMAPFSSRFDAFLRGARTLSPAELRGLGLFEDPNKGNCGGCHRVNSRSPMPERSMFTDFGYEAVAVPRNTRAVHGSGTFDLGVCERHDRSPYTDQPHFCGSFRTPSLRNVALRTSFMHNGVFSNLRDVVAFYATRGTDPGRWYPSGTFDDLPARYHANVNGITPPYERRPGDQPVFDEGEIDAVVAFLDTLTDEKVPR